MQVRPVCLRPSASARASAPPLTRPRAAAGDLKGTEHPGWLYAATDSGEKGLVPENYLERQVLGASRKRAAALRPRCRNSFRDHVLLAGPILGDTSCVQRDIGP